jgi:hypothetical protein
MKYKSHILSQGSGKIGGAVYSYNRGGVYIRAWRKPTNPNTSQQQAVRDALSLLQTRFANTLTAAQRLAWNTFATNVPITGALGDSVTLTGQQWYVKANVPRLQASVAAIDTAPVIFEMAALTTPVPTIVAAGTTVSLAYTNTDAWAGEVGGYLLLFASRPQNPTVNFFKGPFRFAGKVSGAGTPPTSPSVITLPFPIGPAGSRMFFRAVALRADGRPSPDFFLTGTA